MVYCQGLIYLSFFRLEIKTEEVWQYYGLLPGINISCFLDWKSKLKEFGNVMVLNFNCFV